MSRRYVPIQAGQYVLAVNPNDGWFYDLDISALLASWERDTACSGFAPVDKMRIERVVRAMPKTYQVTREPDGRGHSHSRQSVVASAQTAGEIEALRSKIADIVRRRDERVKAAITKIDAETMVEFASALPQLSGGRARP